MGLTNEKKIEIHDKLQDVYRLLDSVITDFAECDDGRSIEVWDIQNSVVAFDNRLTE